MCEKGNSLQNNRSPASKPTQGQQDQKLPGKYKVLSAVNTATPNRRFWQGKRPQRKHIQTPRHTAALCPGAYSGAKICPPSKPPVSPYALSSPLTTAPSSKGLRPPSPSPHLKDIFLRITDSCDCIEQHYRFQGLTSPAFKKTTRLPQVPHMSKQSGCQRCCSRREPELPKYFCTAKHADFLLKFHFPLRTENHWRPTAEAQTLLQAGAASAEPLAKPLYDEAPYAEGQMMQVPQQPHCCCAHLHMGYCLHLDFATPCKCDFQHRCLLFQIGISHTCKIPSEFLHP